MLIPKRFHSMFRTSARGLEAQRIAMAASTENLANARTSRAEGDDPYRIKRAVHEADGALNGRFQSLLANRTQSLMGSNEDHLSGRSLQRRLGEEDLGPRTEIAEDAAERLEYDPTHPHADPQGYVRYADVNVVEEMARMISANRIYEANLTAVESTKQMAKRTLEM
jgi:flagellar basal-body rod protein FlgC